jgi:hypothetical protein
VEGTQAAQYSALSDTIFRLRPSLPWAAVGYFRLCGAYGTGLSSQGKEHCELKTKRKPQFGCIFKRKKKLPDGTTVELGHWWIKYSSGGQIVRESSKSEKYADAERLLKTRVGEMVTGAFHGLQVERTTVDHLLDDVLLDYRTNGRAVRFARAAIEHHLRPYFCGRRAGAVSTEAAKKYVAFRRSNDQGTRPYRGGPRR